MTWPFRRWIYWLDQYTCPHPSAQLAIWMDVDTNEVWCECTACGYESRRYAVARKPMLTNDGPERLQSAQAR